MEYKSGHYFSAQKYGTFGIIFDLFVNNIFAKIFKAL